MSSAIDKKVKKREKLGWEKNGLKRKEPTEDSADSFYLLTH
ncbi:hypothetical protein [Chitinophaga sp.]